MMPIFEVITDHSRKIDGESFFFNKKNYKTEKRDESTFSCFS